MTKLGKSVLSGKPSTTLKTVGKDFKRTFRKAPPIVELGAGIV